MRNNNCHYYCIVEYAVVNNVIAFQLLLVAETSMSFWTPHPVPSGDKSSLQSPAACAYTQTVNYTSRWQVAVAVAVNISHYTKQSLTLWYKFSKLIMNQQLLISLSTVLSVYQLMKVYTADPSFEHLLREPIA